MKDGFIKVAAATPSIRVADCAHNAEQTIALMRQAAEQGVKVLCFPELGLTGYTCADLFLQPVLLRGAEEALGKVLEASKKLDMLVAVGLPLRIGSKLYNCAAVLCRGELLGVVPKINLPNYTEFYEARWFTSGRELMAEITLCGQEGVPVATELIFRCKELPELCVGVELCEDLWVPAPPSVELAKAGATLMLNLSASDEIVCKDSYRRSLVTGQSGRLVCGYVYADAGEGESSTDLVYGGHNLIAENGSLLAERRFETGLTVSEIDVHKLAFERQRMSTFPADSDCCADEVPFSLELEETSLTRYFAPNPFVPADRGDRDARCREIFTLASLGLRKRLEHTHARTAVIGLSGGLDSTLALLITDNAMKLLGRPATDIICVTMPCFGTTDRTRDNATVLAECLGTSFRRVDIGEAVNLHFRDIGHDSADHSVTYENCQARERTQVLMDIANKTGGLVIGTGDLSEMALGWSTYNGDHMSMYAVNCSIPKTLVRHLTRYVSDSSRERQPELSAVLDDILDTPVSPELLPPEENGQIAQKTEDLVGPYELHDFFLYYGIRFAFPPKKVFRLAKYAFQGAYADDFILKWEKNFYHRFFMQQFKRSCIPDGPKVGSVTLSPRGDWRMPSDAVADLWKRELEELEQEQREQDDDRRAPELINSKIAELKPGGKLPAFVISVSIKTGCYRHLLANRDTPLDELAWDILNAFGFSDDHLSAFFMDRVWGEDAYYVTPSFYDKDEEEEEQRRAGDYTLEQVLMEGQKFIYLFDFGEEWIFHCKVLRSAEIQGKPTQIIRSVGDAPEQYPDWGETEK